MLLKEAKNSKTNKDMFKLGTFLDPKSNYLNPMWIWELKTVVGFFLMAMKQTYSKCLHIT